MERIFSYKEPGLYCNHYYDPDPDPSSLPFHAHEIPEVYYSLSGNANYLVEGTLYPLSLGDILLLRPAEAHKLIIPPGESYRHILTYFSPDLFDGIDPDRRLLQPFYARPLGQHNHYPAEQYPELSAIFSDLVLPPGLERFAIISRLLLLLTNICTLYPEIAVQAVPQNSFSSELVAYVNEHLFEELSLPVLSEHFSMSVSQISRVFYSASGTSLWKYVLIKRLLAARAMIQRGEPAQKTAYACGFTDYSSFYRAYIKRFGNAPSADRP